MDKYRGGDAVLITYWAAPVSAPPQSYHCLVYNLKLSKSEEIDRDSDKGHVISETERTNVASL